MPTINGVPNYPQPVENRAVSQQESQPKKPEENRVAQKPADDAVVAEVRSRDTDQIRTERQAFDVAALTSDKIRKSGAPAVEAAAPSDPKRVEELLS